jgi:purine-binding chemotaxis protein CheW
MRPLPIERVADPQPFVLGVALVRGGALPVVDLGALLGEPTREGRRFITVEVDADRSVALLVDEVLGVSSAPIAGEAPPLLRDAAHEAIDAIARRDAHLLTVLRAGRLLPEARG